MNKKQYKRRSVNVPFIPRSGDDLLKLCSSKGCKSPPKVDLHPRLGKEGQQECYLYSQIRVRYQMLCINQRKYTKHHHLGQGKLDSFIHQIKNGNYNPCHPPFDEPSPGSSL
jgi:hypothetical protein